MGYFTNIICFFWELGIRLTWGKILINHWGFGYLAFRQTPMKVGTSFLIMNKSGGYEPWDNVRPKKPAWLTWELLSGFKRWSQKDAEQLFHVRCNSSMTCRFQTCRFLFGSLYTCRTICIQSVRTFYLEVSGKHPNGFVSKYGTVSHLRSTCSFILEIEHAHRIFQGENLWPNYHHVGRTWAQSCIVQNQLLLSG